MDNLSENINETIKYINELEDFFDGKLGEVQKKAYADNIPAIPKETAKFLSVILSIKRPKNVLEIGTATGFSASLISRYLAEDGRITTIDRYDIMLNSAKKTFGFMGIEDKVTVLEGDAAEILPTLTGKYDFIFLDAAKGQYIYFLPYIEKLLDVGGILIADDIFQGGNISQSRYEIPRRQRTIHSRMRAFLWEICHSDVFETALIPIGDGIAFCHKIKEAKEE